MSDPRLSRTAIPCEVIDENGQLLELMTRPFSDDQFVQYDNWLRKQFMNRCMDCLSDLPASKRLPLEEAALIRASSVHIFDRSAGSKILSSVPGLARAIFMSLFDPPPGVSESRVRDLLSMEENRNKLSSHWVSMNLGSRSVKAEAQPGESNDPSTES